MTDWQFGVALLALWLGAIFILIVRLGRKKGPRR